MRTIKIIIGFLLLWGAGAEYVEASREIGSWYSPGIILGVLTMILVCTWLIGTGFANSKYKLTKLHIAKYFGINLILFFLFAFVKLSIYVVPKNFVEINGLKIPLGKCIDGNRRIIPDKDERKKYCKCFVEKITNEPELKARYRTKLESDKINDVFKEIQASTEFQELGIEECMASVKMKWTDNIATSMKRNWKKELEGTEFENTNDLNEYCDCLIEEYRKFPLDSILKDSFLESEIVLGIDEECTEKSKK